MVGSNRMMATLAQPSQANVSKAVFLHLASREQYCVQTGSVSWHACIQSRLTRIEHKLEAIRKLVSQSRYGVKMIVAALEKGDTLPSQTTTDQTRGD
jgi:hypothetical protein